MNDMDNLNTSRVRIEDIAAQMLRSRWFPGFVSLTIIGLLILASWPYWFNRFLLNATTQIIEISASAAQTHTLDVTLPKGAETQIFGANAKGLPPELSSLGASPVSVRLLTSNAVLQAITLPKGAGLVVQARPDGAADIGVLNNGHISLALSGTIDRIDENGHDIALPNIERTAIWDIYPGEKDAPARIVLPSGTSPFTIYYQSVGDFRFSPPRPPGDDPHTYQSDILKGELRLLDTGATIKLRPRELILLEGGDRSLSRLEVIDKAVSVDISGEADRISVGPLRPGTPFRLDRDVTPSVLSYILGQHELKLVWGIAVVVLGALWRARQWALNWRN
jgi:hypothetical protein